MFFSELVALLRQSEAGYSIVLPVTLLAEAGGASIVGQSADAGVPTHFLPPKKANELLPEKKPP